REPWLRVSDDVASLRLMIVLGDEFTFVVKGNLASDIDGALTLGNDAERVWEWGLKHLRRCEVHLRLFLRQTAVVVDADERGGGDGERKANSVWPGFPPPLRPPT